MEIQTSRVLRVAVSMLVFLSLLSQPLLGSVAAPNFSTRITGKNEAGVSNQGRAVNINDYDDAKKDAAKKVAVAAKLIKDCNDLKEKAAAANAAAKAAKKKADDLRKAAGDAAGAAATAEEASGGAGDYRDGRAADVADKAAADAAKAADDARDKAQNNSNDKKAQTDARDKETAAKTAEAAADAADAKASDRGKGEATTKARKAARAAERAARAAEREAAAAAAAAAAAQALVEAEEPCGKVDAAVAAADAAIAGFERLLAEKIKRSGTRGSSETDKDTETVSGWKDRVHPQNSNAANEPARSVAPPKSGTSLTNTSKPEARYTNDWQPGDEVSFSFSGIVYGPTDEKQTQDDFTGYVVRTVDSQGTETEILWSKLIRYKVPETATSVIASFMKPDRTVVSTANISVYPKGTKIPIQLPPRTTGNTVAYPVHQIGQPYTIYSPAGGFGGDANKIRLFTTDKINNTTHVSNAVAASPRSALFSQQVKEPGSYIYTVSDDGRFEESFDVNAVGIKLDTSRAYRTNQQGTLVVIVTLPPRADAQEKLLSENFHVTTEMETPNVLAFANGQSQILWTVQRNEISNNLARKEFPVKAGVPGAFKITARAKTPGSVNPSTTKAGVSGPNVYFRPDDPPEVDCEKLKKDAADALKLAQEKEIEAGRLLVEAERLEGLIKNAEEGGPAYWKDKADQLEIEAKILEDSAERLINEPDPKQQK